MAIKIHDGTGRTWTEAEWEGRTVEPMTPARKAKILEDLRAGNPPPGPPESSSRAPFPLSSADIDALTAAELQQRDAEEAFGIRLSPPRPPDGPLLPPMESLLHRALGLFLCAFLIVGVAWGYHEAREARAAALVAAAPSPASPTTERTLRLLGGNVLFSVRSGPGGQQLILVELGQYRILDYQRSVR